jgi:hypothetical protein
MAEAADITVSVTGDQLTRAQLMALEWMERAEIAETAAHNVIAHERHKQGWPDLAKGHRAEADRAMTFARAWARVAAALQPRSEPVPGELLTLDVHGAHCGHQSDITTHDDAAAGLQRLHCDTCSIEYSMPANKSGR